MAKSIQEQPSSEPDAPDSALPWVVTLRTLMARKTSVAWLVNGLLQKDGSALLLGAAKAGKSTLARQLAATVTRTGDREFLGHRINDDVEGRALVVNMEDSEDTARDHLLRLGADPGRLYITTWGAPPLRDRMNALDEAIGYCVPDLVVIDTVGRWVQFEDGNSYAEVQRQLAPLCDLARRHKTCVLVVHHARKSGGTGGVEALGSTAFAGATDCILSLKVREDGSNARTIEAVGRNNVNMPRTVLTFENDRLSAARTIGRFDAEGLKQRILEEAEKAVEPLTTIQLCDRIGGRKQALTTALDELCGFNDLERQGTGNRGNPFRYSVPRSPSRSGNGDSFSD